jgi:hypothetical protein
MLEAEEPFTTKHPMKKPILDADAVMLVVDASAPKKQLNEEFRQSARWLKHLHEARGRRADIADLPVYVVLTKSDLLAGKTDTLDTWKKTIDEAKHQYEDNFRKYLKQDEPGFGTIKLKVIPSAIKHPALADKPKADGPFGVAELFKDCLTSASEFQERRQASQSRMQNVLVGLFGLIALLVLSVAFLFEFQPAARDSSLDELVQATLPKPNATLAQKLGGTIKRLEERKTALDEIIARTDDFAKLPADTQKEVKLYREEIATYLQLHQKSQTDLKLPHLAKNDAELKELEKAVRGFAIPDGWGDTRLGKRLNEVVDEFDNLGRELKREAAWMDYQTKTNRELLIQGNTINGNLLKRDKDAANQANDWQRRFQAQMNAKPTTSREENVPGVSRMIYEDLVKFEPAKSAHKDWLLSQDDLRSESATMQKRLNALP